MLDMVSSSERNSSNQLLQANAHVSMTTAADLKREVEYALEDHERRRHDGGIRSEQ